MNLDWNIKRALLSVSDKTGIVELANSLIENGCEIISTGGTKRKLEEAGITVTDISKVTGNPEAFGGRMKTISFQIESALLFDREKDKQEANSLNIDEIDLVVCNLYPFKKVLESGGNFEELIENIDIGGPTMLRAAAKNFKYVTVITNPSDYDELQKQMKENDGKISYDYRKQMMVKAFNHTADYDSLIAQTMDKEIGQSSLRLSFKEGYDLRYGENSHQQAKFYKEQDSNGGLFGLKFLHGKALSFNNILDINGAIESISSCDKVACAVVKHSNPCGLAEGFDQKQVLELAWAGDPISAFGSIIAFNTKLELETVKFFNLDHENRAERKFIEVVIAPEISEEALDYLKTHKNLRVLEFDHSKLKNFKDIRYLNGSLLVQDKDLKLFDKIDLPTKTKIDLEQDQKLIEFGLKSIQNIKSNSISIVRKKDNSLQLLGMGAGQPNRLIASKMAIEKCKENLAKEYKGDDFPAYQKEELANCILISDAFFPFPDNVVLAAKHGITKIIQPGGSIKDQTVIDACDQNDIAMAFTGIRHFKH